MLLRLAVSDEPCLHSGICDGAPGDPRVVVHVALEKACLFQRDFRAVETDLEKARFDEAALFESGLSGDLPAIDPVADRQSAALRTKRRGPDMGLV